MPAHNAKADGDAFADVNKESAVDQRFSHISFGESTPTKPFEDEDDDDDLIDVGDVEYHYGDVIVEEEVPHTQQAQAQVYEQTQSPVQADEQIEDYGVESLEPMPLTQKIILFIVLALLVVMGFYVVRYWIGI